MGNKYYVPDETEYRIGFEFELNFNSDVYGRTWKSATVHQECFTDGILFNKKTSYRCRYLDKEDLESLGFSVEHERIFEGPYWFKKAFNEFDFSKQYFLIKPLPIEMRIIFHPEQRRIIACILRGEQDPYVVYAGEVKNKSELKWILKRVGAI